MADASTAIKHTEDSMLVALVRKTAHAFAYARLYGGKPDEGSEQGRNEAWARMTAADVFEALKIVTEPMENGSSRAGGESNG